VAVKKLTAILFLTVFVFNLVGFKLVYFMLQQNADSQFIILVDNNKFDSRNLVQIKIPNPIPYTKAAANFDRIDGEITFNNKVYKYVYRKISENYITILCLPDAKKTKLNTAEKKFERSVNNPTQEQQNTKTTCKLVKTNLTDFDYFRFDFEFNNRAITINKKIINRNYSLKVQPQKVAFLPPQNIVPTPMV
jgi:hypothetical protein